MSHIGRFGAGFMVAVCTACGGHAVENGVSGKAFLLGETDHSGIRVSVLKGSEVVASGQTDASGAYRIVAPAGAFDVRFEHDGYTPFVQPDVVVLQNAVGVSDVTLRRGALLDTAPMRFAQAMGGSKALVQFDHGEGSPTFLVDLAAGTTKRIAPLLVTVVDATDQVATVVADKLYKLDLASAALSAVRPAAGGAASGASGYSFYVGIDGTLEALATGSDQASSLAITACPSSTPFAGAMTDAPGWFSVSIQSSCNPSSQSFATLLVNPALRVARGPFNSILVGRGGAFLFDRDPGSPGTGLSIVRKIDLANGNETPALLSGVNTVQDMSLDRSLFLLTSFPAPANNFFTVTLSLLDLRTGTLTEAARDAFPSGISYLDASFRSVGELVDSSAPPGGSTIIRFDTRRSTPLCTGSAGTALPVEPPPFFNAIGHPVAFVCSTGAALKAYEWDADRVRDLSAVANPGVTVVGRVAIWNEGLSTRAVRLGDGDAPVTLCTTSASAITISRDGSVAALSCPNPLDPTTGRVIAVDLRTGASQTLVAAPARSGSFITVQSMALTAGGRGAVLDYTTNVVGADPASCGATECTLAVDRTTGISAFNATAIGPFNALASPDDRGLAVAPPFVGSSTFATFPPAGPSFARVAASVGSLLGISTDTRFALAGPGPFFGPHLLINLATGTTTSVSGPPQNQNGVPIQLGSSGDFVVAGGIAHLETGTVESLGDSFTPLCGVFGARFAFFDPNGTTLEEYVGGSGLRTIASNVLALNSGNCADPWPLFLAGFDGTSGSLLRYTPASGAVSQIAADVARFLNNPFGPTFAFQHPDGASGDLLRIDASETALPLGARARLGTSFTIGGKRVAFTGGAANEQPKLVTAKLDGSGVRTVGPAANRVFFSPDGTKLLFESGGLLWSEDPAGPGFALDRFEDIKVVLVSGTADLILYSVSSGDRRGTYRVDLRRNAQTGSTAERSPVAWLQTSF